MRALQTRAPTNRLPVARNVQFNASGLCELHISCLEQSTLMKKSWTLGQTFSVQGNIELPLTVNTLNSSVAQS
jgi:hypothetical protein